MKILVCGLSGSGKSVFSVKLCEALNAKLLNADSIRKRYDDWDFSLAGRRRQALRMRRFADDLVKKGHFAVADFICPTEEFREIYDADFVIWMNTVTESQYKDTDKLFEPVTNADYVFTEWLDYQNSDEFKDLVERIRKFDVQLREALGSNAGEMATMA
jgi:adenylate kinase family enzyme